MRPEAPDSAFLARIFPCDSLLEKGRTPRPALRRWAPQLLDRLAGATPGVDGAERIAGALNNAALIQVFLGNPAAARALCLLQLNWVAELCKEHGTERFGHLAPQPWINLGRLLRMKGDGAAALTYFSLALDALAPMARWLGPVRIEAESWARIERAHPILGFLTTAYLLDSLKVHLQRGDSPSALALIEQARSILGQNALFDEAELTVRIRLGQFREVEALIAKNTWSSGRFVRLVGFTYAVATLAASGARERARALVLQLEINVQRLGLPERSDERTARYLHRLGALAESLDAAQTARRLWSAGWRVAQRAEDVPLELSFLEALLADAKGAERGALEAERAALLEECLYATLLKPRGLKLDPARAADPLFAELMHRIETVTGQRSSHGAGSSHVSSSERLSSPELPASLGR